MGWFTGRIDGSRQNKSRSFDFGTHDKTVSAVAQDDTSSGGYLRFSRKKARVRDMASVAAAGTYVWGSTSRLKAWPAS